MSIVFLWFPVIIAVGEFLLLAATGGVIGYSIAKLLKNLKGGSFCILGEKGVGKTVLHEFLSCGEITTKAPKMTITTKKTKKNILKLEDCEFEIKESKDINGSEDYRDLWEGLIKKSDYICYLVRGDKIYNNDNVYSKKVLEHVNHIFDFKPEQKGLYILVSHLDKIEGYFNDAATINEKINHELKTSIYKQGTKVIYGSLKDNSETKKIVTQLINHIMEKK